MWYSVNFRRLAVLLTPPFLRDKVLYFVYAVFKPLQELHDVWLRNRASNLYKITHNSQVCYLRAALNDAFDYDLRRINIIAGNKYKKKYIYTRAEQKPVYLGVLYVHSRDDYEDTGVDFIVEIPNNLVYNEDQMKATINFYKLASKRYKILKK